jgi:hypothetical protein
MAGRSGLNVNPEDHSALRSLAYRLTGETGRRVTLTEALRAACSVASRDLAATVAALTKPDTKE